MANNLKFPIFENVQDLKIEIEISNVRERTSVVANNKTTNTDAKIIEYKFIFVHTI